jgi:hypothetical protein
MGVRDLRGEGVAIAEPARAAAGGGAPPPPGLAERRPWRQQPWRGRFGRRAADDSPIV